MRDEPELEPESASSVASLLASSLGVASSLVEAEVDSELDDLSAAVSPESSPPQPAPAYSTPADYQRIGYTGTLDMSTAVPTVTPLHMLGDQPDTVDCPFCMRRVETSVKKKASSRTQ